MLAAIVNGGEICEAMQIENSQNLDQHSLSCHAFRAIPRPAVEHEFTKVVGDILTKASNQIRLVEEAA